MSKNKKDAENKAQGWGKLSFSTESLKAVEACQKPLIAAIRPETVDLELKGTRSQRIVGTATVIAPSDSILGSSLPLHQHWSGNEALKTGKDYLVLLCVEDRKEVKAPGSVKILQWEPVPAADIQKRLKEETDRFHKSGSFK